MRSFAAAAALCVAFPLASCTGDSAGPPAHLRVPAAIGLDASGLELNDGDTVPVAVDVFDQHDRVFSPRPAGMAFEWSSDDESIARVEDGERLVGRSPGVTTIRARFGDMETEATVAVRPVAHEVVVIEAPAQGGQPSAPLPDSVVLRAIDRHGNGVGGVAVRFAVVAGGGTVAPSTAISDDDGLVRVEWTLGPVIGPQTMHAFLASGGEPIAIETTISHVVRARVDAAAGVARGGSLPVIVRIDSDLFPAAIGGAHVVLSWDPSSLSLAAPVGAGDYSRVRSRVDAANGELHLVALDPAIKRGAMAAAYLTFDVNGAVGASTTISVSIAQLVGVDFSDVTAAGIAEHHVVHIE